MSEEVMMELGRTVKEIMAKHGHKTTNMVVEQKYDRDPDTFNHERVALIRPVQEITIKFEVI